MLCDRWALFKINVKGKKKKKNTSTCTFDWLTLNMCQVQVAALHIWPQPQRHCRGFVQNELPVQKSIKCHQDLSCTWQIKVAGSADALLRCTADANRQSVTVGSSVTDEKNSAEQMGGKKNICIFSYFKTLVSKSRSDICFSCRQGHGRGSPSTINCK